MTSLDNFKKTCKKHLVIEDMSYIDVVFGTIFANRLDSKPVWLYLVGAPSSGKTEILQSIKTDEVIQVGRIGQYSLISFYQPKDDKGNIVKDDDRSLLLKLNGRTMIIKDFTAMINDRRETLMAVAGQLRDAYDGYTSRSTGIDHKSYTSKFGIIAAVTNIIDRHRGILAELGERFLTYRCPDISNEEVNMRCWKVSDRSDVTQKETEIRLAAEAVLKQKCHKVVLSDSFRNRVIETAQYVASARCEITRDRNTKEAEIPTPEIATRLTRQLCDLALGIAMVKGHRHIDTHTEKAVHKTALDCLTLKRIRLLKILYDNFPAYLSSNAIGEQMRYSESAIRRWLDDLHLLDLVERKITPTLDPLIRNKVEWRICYRSVLRRIWG